MKVKRILTVCIKRESVLIPAPEKTYPSLPEFIPIGTGSGELSSLPPPMEFNGDKLEMHRWRILAAIYSDKMPAPKYGTHVSCEIGRTAQEAWSRFVSAHAKCILGIALKGVTTFVCLEAKPIRPSKQSYPAGIPQFPSLFVIARDSDRQIDSEEAFGYLPKSKMAFKIMKPQARS